MNKANLYTFALIFSFLLSGMNPNNPSIVNYVSVNERIDPLLNDYSNYLVNGRTQNNNQFSSSMNKLVIDRRQFYKEFLEIGLHTTFVGFESKFTPISDANIEKFDSSIYSLHVTENVTLHGKSMISSPEEYPLVQSAHWAIAHSDNEIITQKLNEYLENMVNSVNDSLHEDIKIELVLKHTIKVEDKNGDLLILQDEYDDKSIDDTAGTDVVMWRGGEAVRVKPDWTQSPDFIFFHTPVEKLGKSLLSDYEAATNNQVQPESVQSFSHSNTASYANSYSSNTTLTCSDGSTLQDSSYYNSSYNYYNCSDCANFVSQAIRYGGFSTDGSWYPYSIYWINSNYLENYLVSSGKLVFAGNLSSLQPGDIAWTGDLGHVVVYSAVNPSRYTAHTNDRLRKNWDSSLTKYGLLY